MATPVAFAWTLVIYFVSKFLPTMRIVSIVLIVESGCDHLMERLPGNLQIRG